MIPLFIEVNAFLQMKLDDNKLGFNISLTKRISLPLDIIASISEEVLTLENKTELDVSVISLKTGKDHTVKETYIEIQQLIEEALPSHLKKESWE